jgi:hypothetical protein
VAGSVLLGGFLANPGVALADAAGPTDYRSEITQVSTADGSPRPSGFNISIEGHDSFLLLVVERGVTAEVPGYEGEPYLKFDADGSVFENRLSFSTIYNRDRYGSVERPDYIDNLAEPEWILVDDDGSYAWHDHRIHYMNTRPPIGAEPGDVIIEMAVPIRVDGVPVEVDVTSTLLESNSPVAMIAVSALMALGGGLLTSIAVASALTALAAGIAWFLSVPGDTDPSLNWLLLPTTALIAAGLSIVAAQRSNLFLACGGAVIAALQLAIWLPDRLGSYEAALIPTALPQWLDRGMTATLVGATIALFSGSVAGLIRISR